MEIVIILISLTILLFSVILHEVAHGTVAYMLGDPTAKLSGRLTLNPLKHLDWTGSVFLPLVLVMINSPILFGWAKPVPVNPFNFKDKRWGDLKVGIAGVAVNFLIAVSFSLLARFFFVSESFFGILYYIAVINFILGIFNLLPIPPLDGSHVLFSLLGDRFSEFKIFMRQYGIFLLVALIFLGLGWIFDLSSFLFYLISGR
ncbi:MAG: site-2 protease family protein [Candidatus Paceibacterota bacterium]|jgi:Zn-dependent protease|nr:site-2 protease family protein [Candidatus Paceibacterota bacterium]MDD4830798.1 site-2 protease family protein [Candidatus Paceibacterota bacterium]MDD4875280.1 site-2 protease family protein [Candidatus Paceibacterota bacterium]